MFLFQIQRLRQTWELVRQLNKNDVDSLRLKLAPFYTSMRDGSSPLPLHGITVPYVIPTAELLERSNPNTVKTWTGADPLDDMHVMLSQLDVARIVCDQSQLYKSTSAAAVGQLSPNRDLLELFDTRMHLLLLWGFRGWSVSPPVRYEKFEQVLRAMSLKCEAASQHDMQSCL